jgi:RNA polymerase sigma-70 factor (ECF subfamily)
VDNQTRAALDIDAWVDAYGDALFHFALARVKKRDVAEDLVQETFLAAVRAREGFQGRSSEKTWLFGILKHKIIDHYRKAKTTALIGDMVDKPDAMEAFFNDKGGWRMRPAHWSTHPGKAHDTREFLDHFYRCLAELPRRTAEAFVYREIDGLDTATICHRIGISAANCWTMLYRARMLLRKCLELYGFHPQVEGTKR